MGSGADRERELVAELEDVGYPAVRMGGSGSGTKRPLPDIIIKADGVIIAGEMKYTSDDYAYIKNEELDKLMEFASKWEMHPLAIARFSHDTNFYVVPLRGGLVDKEMTGSGNLSMKRARKNQYHELIRYLEKLERAT